MRTKLFISLLTLMLALSAKGQVIISQYYEGASNNKWIEIANVGSETVSFNSPQIYLALFSNANADNPSGVSPNSTYTLSGTIAPGSTMLFRNSGAVLPAYAEGIASSICNFNGDDLVIITTSTGTNAWADRIDVIGNGESWGVDKSFFRNASIQSPNVNFTLSEWTEASLAEVHDAASNQPVYLGYHLAGSEPPVPTVSNPVITPASGTYTAAKIVEITCATVGATIYYTTNGENPSASSLVYTSPFTLNSNATIKAIAILDGKSSGIASAVYTFEFSSTDANIPYVQHFTLDEGNFTSYSAMGEQFWSWGTYDNGCMVMSGYVGRNNANSAWLISPTFDFTSYTNLELQFTEAINYITDYDDLQLKISTGYAPGDPELASWTSLPIPIRSAGNNWNFISTEGINLLAYEGLPNVTIAFHYTSTTEGASTWQIGQFRITGDISASEVPDQHVTNFSAVAGSITQTAIELAWTENDGQIVPDGYLLKASIEAIVPPANGIDPQSDTDLTDGAGQVKIPHGTSSYLFDNCTPGTSYNFAIFPYKSSGESILYKTDAAPSISAKTLDAPIENVANPANFVAATVSTSEIALQWQLNAAANHVIVASMPHNEVSDTLINDSIYAVNDVLPHGSVIVYKGSAESFSHQNLLKRQYYGYRIWSVSPNNQYSSGLSAMAATLSDEPSNPVANLDTVSVGSASIKIQWNDNQGSNDADGFLVVIQPESGAPFVPADFTEYAKNTNLANGNGFDAVAPGIQTYTWTGLTPGTYRCLVIPYANSGEFINYNTQNIASIIVNIIEKVEPIVVADPLFAPDTAIAYTDSVDVNITTTTADAKIFYVINGSAMPNENSLEYSTPIRLYETSTIKAIAILGNQSSQVVEATYQVTPTPVVVAAPAIAPNASTFVDTLVVTITCETPGANIFYTNNGDEPTANSLAYTGAFTIRESATIKAIAVVGNWLSPISSAIFEREVVVVPTQVSSIAQLRAMETGTQLYTFTGEAVVTMTQTHRQQKWIQDATGAILIDDNSRIINDAYSIGEGMTDLTGTIANYFGLLQFTPTKNPVKIASPTYIPVAQTLTVDEFKSNFKDYESELIKLERVTFEAAGNFANGQDYVIDQNGEKTVFRSHSFNLDYIGTAIPTAPQTITGIAIWHYEKAKIFARSKSDFANLTSSNKTGQLLSIKAGKNSIVVEGNIKANSQVRIYDITGRQISVNKLQAGSNRIQVEKPGLYLVGFQENNKTIQSQKVIVK